MIESAQFSLSSDDLSADPLGFQTSVARGAEVALRTGDGAVVAAALRALDGWASAVHLLPGDLVAPEGLRVIDTFARHTSPISKAEQVRPPDSVHVGSATQWVIYTSGTTGVPKAVRHTLATLTRTITQSPVAAEHRWGLLYDPNRMAGLQVLLQALTNDADLIVCDPTDPLGTRVQRLRHARVSALSATPTLWRQIVQLADHSTWPSLHQITLGGEIADQRVLDALSKSFPDARITHIFASTETGAAFSVNDKREGFPAEFLATPPRGIRLMVKDGTLLIHAPGVSTAGADGFVDTGDHVEIVEDRVRFLGRGTGVVNIGGANVWPEVVERLLRDHPDVAEATVSPKSNTMTGNVLVATVVLNAGAEADGVSKRLRSWIRANAPVSHVPATVRVVDSIDVSSAGKVQRP